MKKDWYVYIVQCRDGKLYTGISNDVEKRVTTHNKGKGCRFTRFRYPVVLIYQKHCGNKSTARRRELEIQKLRKVNKLELISKKRSFGS